MKNGDQNRTSVTAGMGRLISRHPGKIVVLFLAITVWMALPLKNINTSTKMSDYLPDCEYLDTDKKMREYFDASKSMVSILTADSGDIMSRQSLIVLRDIEQAIVDSDLVNKYLISDDRAVDTVGGILDRALVKKSKKRYTLDDLPEKYMKRAITKVLEAKRTESLVSTEQGGQRDSAAIAVHFNYNKIERDNEDAELALLKVMHNNVPEGYSLVSLAAKNYHLEQDAKKGMRTTLPISLALLLVVLMITLRNVVDFLTSVVGLAVTMIISFGAFCLLGLRFSLLANESNSSIVESC
jgi:predicted RND superfamily exporter protein